MKNATIETYTGKLFDILSPKLDQICIEDIAHSLSLLCRFTGHVRHFYSVAQHCLLGSYLVSEEHALEFLLHDATEAYLGDMSRPLKHATPAGTHYRKVEEKVASVIRKRFGLPKKQSKEVHTVDNQMLYAEKNQLMGNTVWSDDMIKSWEAKDRTPADVIIVRWDPKYCEDMFLLRAKFLLDKKLGVIGEESGTTRYNLQNHNLQSVR